MAWQILWKTEAPSATFSTWRRVRSQPRPAIRHWRLDRLGFPYHFSFSVWIRFVHFGLLCSMNQRYTDHASRPAYEMRKGNYPTDYPKLWALSLFPTRKGVVLGTRLAKKTPSCLITGALASIQLIPTFQINTSGGNRKRNRRKYLLKRAKSLLSV